MNSFSQSDLKEMALSCASKITRAKNGVEYFDEPFKHVVLDNFFLTNLQIYAYRNSLG